MRLTEEYIRSLVRAVKDGYSDPISYIESRGSYQSWRLARQAWLHWAARWNNDALRLAVEKLRGPRQIPAAPRIVPTPEELRLAAERAAGMASPEGPLCWILFLGGLRVREVCSIAYDEAVDALRRPEVIIRQKGIGGFARRTWTPGCLVRPALAALLRLPIWRQSGLLLSGTIGLAAAKLRSRSGAFRPHDYRHAVARTMRQLGTPADVLSAVLGHDLRAVMGTTAIYAPPSPAEIEQAHARLAAYLWPDGLVPPAGSWLDQEACRSAEPPGGIGVSSRRV